MEDSNKKESGARRLLAALFKRKEEKDEDVGEEKTAEKTPPPEESDPFLLPVEGPLLQLWRKWEPYVFQPSLSLVGGAEDKPLPLTEREVVQERQRIGRMLEQDARVRLQMMAKAESQDQPGQPPQDLGTLCRTYVSQNGMVAWMMIFPPRMKDGELTMEAMAKAMKERNITTGIDSIAMTEMFQKRQFFFLRPIAIGTPVIEGSNGRIEQRFKEAPKGVQLDENGLADYRAGNYVWSIQKGDIICDIIPPEEGSAGVRVDGKALQPKPVRPAKPPKGSNTALSEDGTHLVATMDGRLEYAGSVFEVKSVLDVPGDVDYNTGNLDFRGDVHIHGDVRENFHVRATGTVLIDGLVEGATVEAGGDVVITRGVLGDNRALIKSRGTVRAKYLENCVAYAGGDVIADCIMASQIFSDAQIVVTSGRGTVIGGALTAAEGIKARIIGSQSGRKTEVTLGVLPYVQEERNDNEEDLKGIQEELSRLEKELPFLEQDKAMEGSSAKLAKARLRKSVLSLKVNKLTKRQLELEKMEPDLTKCRMECNTIYPLTVVNIGGNSRNIETVWTKCTVTYDVKEKEICFL